jgi:hypothetical protein
MASCDQEISELQGIPIRPRALRSAPNARKPLRQKPTYLQEPIPQRSWKRRSKCWIGTRDWKNPFGDGTTGRAIVDVLDPIGLLG